MVNYNDCSSPLDTIQIRIMAVCQDLALSSLADFLVYPTGCNYYFYLWFLGGLFVIIAWFLYKEDDDKGKNADMISSLGVTSIGITATAAIGTLVKSTEDIALIQSDILLYIVSFTVVICLIWFFKD